MNSIEPVMEIKAYGIKEKVSPGISPMAQFPAPQSGLDSHRSGSSLRGAYLIDKSFPDDY